MKALPAKWQRYVAWQASVDITSLTLQREFLVDCKTEAARCCYCSSAKASAVMVPS